MRKLVITLALVLAIIGSAPLSTYAMTNAEIQAIIAQLYAQLNANTGGASSSEADPNGGASDCLALASVNLRYQARDASTNNEVSALQDFLNTKGYLTVQPTGYFGLATVAAVKSFQTANGISATGYAGPLTRARINTLSCVSVHVDNSPIIFTFPNNGAVLTQGQTYQLTWSGSTQDSMGIKHPMQSIVLVVGPTAHDGLTLATVNTDAQKYFTWTVPTSVTPGSGYRLVFSANGQYFSSNDSFTIVASTPNTQFQNTGTTPSVQSLIFPKVTYISATSVTVGDTVTIQGSGFASDALVRLLQNGQQVCALPISGRSADGTQITVTVSVSANCIGGYYLDVFNPSSGGSNLTGFTVSAAQNNNSIQETPIVRVVSPNGGENIGITTQSSIQWTTNIAGDVLVYLRFSDGGMCKLADLNNKPVGLGSLSFTPSQFACPSINKTIVTGQYTIGVFVSKPGETSDAGTANDFSDSSFTIGESVAPIITAINPTQGSSNSLVVITGTNLNAVGNTIFFYQNGQFIGSQYQSTPSADGTQLQFAPSSGIAFNANPGVYQIKVGNRNGTSNSLDFTILP